MRVALTLVRLTLTLMSLTLTGCVAGPGLLPGSTDNVQAMRADLRACTLGDGAWAFALIPDFGTTGDHQRVKCMLQRGWLAGPDRTGGGVRDYMRIEPVPVVLAPAPIAPTEPTWATGE
jgi:hypothetical protein